MDSVKLVEVMMMTMDSCRVFRFGANGRSGHYGCPQELNISSEVRPRDLLRACSVALSQNHVELSCSSNLHTTRRPTTSGVAVQYCSNIKVEGDLRLTT